MNAQALKDFITAHWDKEVLPVLCDYIRSRSCAGDTIKWV